MDISLHSFILVVGLVVITFIVWDGIKRVRESRMNRLNENMDILDEDSVNTPQEYHAADYDELEIADELLQSDFIGSIDSEKLSAVSNDEAELIGVQLGAVDCIGVSVDADSDVVSVAVRKKISDPVAKQAEKREAFKKELLNRVPLAQEPFEHSDTDLITATAVPLDPVIESLLDNQTVPVLMEPVELGGEVEPNPPKQQELHLPEFVQQTLQDDPITAHAIEPKIEMLDPLFSAADQEVIEEKAVPSVACEPVGEKLSERAAAQEIFVINVVKESEPLLKGPDLMQVFTACDLRHGEMDIFHRFEQARAQGKIQFSVVNVLKPGIFDLNTMADMATPGISLFMSLPGPQNPMEAFDAMSEVALVFARNFNASLYDESHSDLTPQTLEHYRNRIREHTRKHLSSAK